MPQEQRSIIEMRPDRTQVRTAIVIGIVLSAGALAVRLPGDVQLREFPVFVAGVDAMLVVCDLVSATLLFAQAAVFRSRAFMVLAAGYLFTALMRVPHPLSFPGTVAPAGVLGADYSGSIWLAVFWRAGFATAIGAYAMVKSRRPQRLNRPILIIAASVVGTLALAIALSTLATGGADLLPQLADGPRAWHYSNFVPMVAGLIALDLAALAVVLKGQKSRLDVWLLLSLAAWVINLLLFMSTSGRFTAAWYFGHVVVLVSHVIVMLVLLADAIQSYARLAISLSQRNRERDARLMSMDAVAAAIAHEVQQPLSAIILNASAGLRWLDRDPPNLKVVSESLQTSVEQGRRASSVIAGIRSVLARRSGRPTTFCLNELIRETTLLLDRELSSGRISLDVALDERVQPIFADRVQIQQIIVNLLTNAIQSLRATKGRKRLISIRSTALDDGNVLVDVNDNGKGMTDEEMEHIFDAFFTTKAKGTGIGLSLCRIIAQEHGGRMWASHGHDHGATLHLQLPCSAARGSGIGAE